MKGNHQHYARKTHSHPNRQVVPITVLTRNLKGGKITGKGKIRTGKLDFDDVYFVKELKFNLFSVSQMCDKKNSVLFTNTKCIVLSSDFKLPDENHVLLRVPIENNVYTFDLKNIVNLEDLTCLFAKVRLDESNLWHRRLGHINFKTMNKLVKGNLVRGIPSKVFENNHTCVACKKGKQHRASCKSEPVSSVSLPLQRVLVTKPHNKTPYELLLGRTPSIGFMRPFGCPVTILNTLDPLGKFDRKADEGFLVGYSVRSGPTCLFDIDTLTQSMNYQPIVTGNQPNSSAGIQENLTAGTGGKEAESVQLYVLLPLWSTGSKDPLNTDAATTFEVKEPESAVHVSLSSSDKTKKQDDKTKREAKGKSPVELSTGVRDLNDEFEEFFVNNTNGGHTQKEGIDYEEVFAPVACIEAIRLFLAYASFMDFMVYQMDVKSVFLYGTIEEEVYVYQPSGFEDPDYLDKVYKVIKALYRLHQAPRAWYETLANYLLENGFQRGKIDQTLFIKKQKGDILLVQVYVDDIIFGSTIKELCKPFEKLMKDKFQMSLMGELTFFLGLQVKQKEDGIFNSQDKYVAKILRKFGLTDGKSASTPIDIEKPLLKDPDDEDVDVYTYRSMIGSLIYLTSSRPDIMFVVCACAHFQVTLKASHLHAVKRIFRYVKGKPHLGLWYPKASLFNLVAYSDSDYSRASLDRKSTTGWC
uniref:Retrovirus-related Pol polyprotein from transposon TNT 1-94 n=1 Tax=Tanacetum cinerariifolium TaxID=118510 RepID=A0A699I446_TANCI|nr:retrovirus-related Pol polyprotein from transposon TNT 1-94 [Tanacetum cinerariifolium]